MKNKPLIIGLTGGIGMGKSTAAKILRSMGFPVHNADKAAHDLLKKNGAAFKRVSKLFPDCLNRGAIDRQSLGHAVFDKPDQLYRLEKILHPLVHRAERDCIKKAVRKKARAVILDIPLLFETGAEKRCDVVLCVTAPPAVQKARVMSRPGMTMEKFRAIRARQWPEKEKRARADYLVPTGNGIEATARHLHEIIKQLLAQP